MQRTHINCRGLVLTLVALVAGIASASALADHNGPVRIQDRGPVRISVHQGPVILDDCHRAPIRSWAEIERDRGERDGYAAGRRAGFEDGYHGRAHHCVCVIDLSCESRPYQRGFQIGFDRGYDCGFREGLEQRERERCRSNSHWDRYSGWSVAWRW